MSEGDVSDLVVRAPRRGRAGRWKALIGLAGLVGLAVAAFTTVDDARDQVLPGLWPLLAAGTVHLISLVFAARAWVALFPPDADRALLVRALYTSQLTKYLPAGGVMQVASQVSLSSDQGGLGAAAIRMPVLSLCSLSAAASAGSLLALSDDLPAWGRVLAGAGLLSLLTLNRRLLTSLLRTARRLIPRLPDPAELPAQSAILRCYAYALVNIVLYGCAFVILLGDLADIDPLTALAALCAGWAAGYLVLPVPSGLGVREAVLRIALPGIVTGSLLGASLAHRLLGLAGEGIMAGQAQLRASLARRAERSAPDP